MSLEENTKSLIRSYYQAVAKGIPGFKPRAGQRQMVAAISQTLSKSKSDDGSHIVLVEGRTGVGKTMGYLIPSLVMAVEQKKTLIVSSATVALQEQLVERDVPAVLEFFPDKSKVKFCVAKGRNRYACLTKLAALSGTKQGDDFFGAASWDRPPQEEELKTLAKLGKLVKSGWDGDRDSLDFQVPDDLWVRLTNDSNGCPGRACESHDECPFVRARNKMRGSNVIVANHDFILSSLNAESMMLPDPDETIIVFDECHHLPEIAVRRFACAHSVRAAINHCEKLGSANVKVAPLLKLPPVTEALDNALSALTRHLTELTTALEHSTYFTEENPLHRYEHGKLDEAMQHYADQITPLTKVANEGLRAVLSALDEKRKESTDPPALINKHQQDLGFFVQRIQNLFDTWCLMSANDSLSPTAKWIEMRDGDFIINASPLHAGITLDRLIWRRFSNVVLTSATVTTCGAFDFFMHNAGLMRYEGATATAVASPFNFKEQGQILIPNLRANPKDPQAHSAEITRQLPALLKTYKGSLVLFASKRQMNEVYEGLQRAGQASSILVQGSMPKREILKVHAEMIKAGLSSTIFGLAGFGEGVDLPGELCQQVIITKVPFAPPDTPVELAIQEWVSAKGGNPFNDISLPKAGLKLTQWVGRLIRTEEDTGRVVFLDSRMGTAGYRHHLIRSLPEFNIVRA